MPYGIYKRRKYTEPPRTRSGYKGVIFCPNLRIKRWKAYGTQHGWYTTIGYFSTKAEAAAAYNAWALKTHGPTAYLNPLS